MVLGGIGHHMIRIELCSASSRLSLRSTLTRVAQELEHFGTRGSDLNALDIKTCA
jgi:hypothetical protein